MKSEPIFVMDGAIAMPSGHARGPWDPRSLHGGAPGALLAREIERAQPGAEMAVVRLTFDFLGAVPLAALEARAWVVRPGRRMQVVDAELRAQGKVVLRASAVRLRRAPQSAGATAVTPFAGDGPQTACPSPFPIDGELGFHRTGMELLFANGTTYGFGPAQTWFRLARPLVDAEPPTPLQRVVAAADFGNGVSRVLDFDTHLFVNTDLTVHLEREAVGEWIMLDAATTIGPSGAGLATSTVFDTRGRIGIAAQSLFVEAR